MSGPLNAGFVGLGNMGAPMSANLAKSGAQTWVYDIDAALTARHGRKIGARAAGDLAELGAAVDLVVLMLPTSKIVRAALFEGDAPLVKGLKAGAMVIDMSSSDPTDSIATAALLAQKNIRFVDAPVSGAVPRATDGTLTIMVGAQAAADFAEAEAVLLTMGNKVVPTGGVGSGHAMKALNNYCAAAGFAAASEALILAEKFGIDPAVAIDIINTSTGRNFSTESTIKSQVLTGAYASGFGLALLAKDVGIAAAMARSVSADMPMVATASDWWAAALEHEGASQDHTTAFRSWKARA